MPYDRHSTVRSIHQNDASLNTRVELHSGPTATGQLGCVALPGTRSPQSFISATI